MKKEIILPKTTCEKCGRTRLIRVPNPLRCPSCGHFPGTKIRNKKPETASFACKLNEAASNPRDYQ